ncbi:MAG: hypothetical protein JSW73_00265 [Candidatus Woesearchaeota archaeon]|nr:MAG: hypothetical protein JSW73_00265 [Candidatus Woesearchaeota archaeon]
MEFREFQELASQPKEKLMDLVKIISKKEGRQINDNTIETHVASILAISRKEEDFYNTLKDPKYKNKEVAKKYNYSSDSPIKKYRKLMLLLGITQPKINKDYNLKTDVNIEDLIASYVT